MIFHFQVILCAILWGSAFPVIKYTYNTFSIDTLGEQLLFAGARFIFAGLFILPFCRSKIQKQLPLLLSRPFLFLCLGQTWLQYFCFYQGLHVSSGALGALLTGLGSFWWMILAPFILKSPWPSLKNWIGFVLCLVGAMLAVYRPGSGAGNVGLGAILFSVATLGGAMGAIALKKLSELGGGARAMTAASLFFGGILLVLSALILGIEFRWSFSLEFSLILTYLAALSATAFTLWNQLIEKHSVNRMASYRFLIPLFGVIESILFIPEETLGFGLLFGGCIILFALRFCSEKEEIKK